MKSLYFKNTLTGKDMATYLPCKKPVKRDEFSVEVVNIPDDVIPETVKALLNKTGILNANIIDFSALGEGKIITQNWGGFREGAGRKPSGKKAVAFYITEDEKEKLKAYLDKLRSEE